MSVARRTSVDNLRPVVTYPREAVLNLDQLAAALGVGRETAEKMDLPFFLAGKRQRFIWGQVLDLLAERADPSAAPLPQRGSRRR